MPMRFPYLKAARVKLQERKNACMRADYSSAEQYTGQFLSFIQSDPVVRTVTAELSVIAQAKVADFDQRVNTTCHRLDLPRDRVECAAFHLRLLERLADPNPQMVIPDFTFIFGGGSNRYQDVFNDFFEQVLQPLCSYIDERIDDGDLLLYMLCRYQRECAWFERKALVELADQADPRKLEETMDSHLRLGCSGRVSIIPFRRPVPLPAGLISSFGKARSLSPLK